MEIDAKTSGHYMGFQAGKDKELSHLFALTQFGPVPVLSGGNAASSAR